jgi:hypothetical protein
MQKLVLPFRSTLLSTSLMFMLATSIFLVGCKNQPSSDAAITIQAGKLINVEKIGEYDTAKLNRILNEELNQYLEGMPMTYEDFKGKFEVPKYSVTLYKITYQSSIPEMDNKPTKLSGLVAIPTTLASGTPMVSYQHGTVFSKTEVPSHLDESIETKLMVAQFGGQGYIVIGADYHGLGDSPLPNAYIVRKSTEQACMDMYKAAQEFLAQQKIKTEHLFTLGWSQGGWSNLLFLRQLEYAKIPVTASATAAAPADISAFATSSIVNPRPNDAIWLSGTTINLLFSYESYHGIKDFTTKAIRPAYLQAGRDFYEFKIDFFEFLKRIEGKRIQELLNPAFLEEMKRGDSEFSKHLFEGEAYRWGSTTPLRNYYGKSDEAIPEYVTTLAVEYQKLLGKKNGEVILAGEKANHRNAFVFAVADVKPWFDSFLKK